MVTLNHHNTFALLVGTSQFPSDPTITAIPNVEANLLGLKKILFDTTLVGVPQSNIIISLNESKIGIEKKLRDISLLSSNASHSLFVYLCGHGILSSEDYQLYLPTHATSRQDLEIEGLNIDTVKKYVRKSTAVVKIIMLDCCHSGSIIGTMNSIPGVIQSKLNSFEGTYIMTSTAEDTPSLFPNNNPGLPTFFTGKFLETVEKGIDEDTQYCSLRDIFSKVEMDLLEMGLPSPQQSNINTADELFFSVNKKFFQKQPGEQRAWENACLQNTVAAYRDFLASFPSALVAAEAQSKKIRLEDEEDWQKAKQINTLFAYNNYRSKYPGGTYGSAADAMIENLKKEKEKRTTDKNELTDLLKQEKWQEEKTVNIYRETKQWIQGLGRDFTPANNTVRLQRAKLNKLLWKVFLLSILSFFTLIYLVSIDVFGAIPLAEKVQMSAFDESSKIFSEDGQYLGEYGGREFTSINKISPAVIPTLITVEDSRFYQHCGIDFISSVKAIITFGISGHYKTITQKLAGILINSGNRNVFSWLIDQIKITILAIRLERAYTKEEILAFYLNSAKFSNDVEGITEASNRFFSTNPFELKWTEAAILVGMLKDTSKYNPVLNAKASVRIRDKILDKMAQRGYISQNFVNQIRGAEPDLNYSKPAESIWMASSLTELTKQFLTKWCDDHFNKIANRKYDAYRDNLKVYTTLNWDLQEIAQSYYVSHLSFLQSQIDSAIKIHGEPFWKERQWQDYLKNLVVQSDRWKNGKAEGMNDQDLWSTFDTPQPMRVFAWNKQREKDTIMTPFDSIKYYQRILQAGLIMINSDDASVEVCIGGFDQTHFKNNAIVPDFKRTVGTLIQPFLYCQAFEQLGFSLNSNVEETQQNFGHNQMLPLSNTCSGRAVSLTDAFSTSDQCAAAYVMKQIGPAHFSEFMQSIYINTPLEPYPSLALGECELSLYEMIGAYSMFPSQGFTRKPMFISRIVDKHGNILANLKDSQDRREVINASTSYQIIELMQKSAEHEPLATIKKNLFSAHLAAQIGSTKNNTDLWSIGILPQLLAGSWMGFQSPSMRIPAINMKKEEMATEIWANIFRYMIMDKRMGIYTDAEFVRPAF